MSRLAHGQALEFSLTELEMDFCYEEFQFRVLAKLLSSSTYVFNGVAHHCTV